MVDSNASETGTKPIDPKQAVHAMTGGRTSSPRAGIAMFNIFT
jgi:hypothetical protein